MRVSRWIAPCLVLGMVASVVPGRSLAAAGKERLMNPATLDEKAPATFRVKFDTTKGAFVVEVNREWAPRGADRFYNLAKNGYFDGVKFFRFVPNFIWQFGIHGDPQVSKNWVNANIADDPVKESNKRGYVTYAKAGANSRTTQLFINLSDRNSFLDGQGFAPFGRVVEGMDVVERFYSGYGETPPQNRIYAEGNAFLEKEYPNLDSIKSASLLKGGEKKEESKAAPK